MTPRLFVYGTLAPGRVNAHMLADVVGTWEAATVVGTLYPEGWGAAAGYPGLVLDASGAPVPGFLLTSASLPGHWARLDAFEGAGYERVSTKATRADGAVVDSFVYALSHAPPMAPEEAWVTHAKFGRGRVIELRACGTRRRFRVRFEDGALRLIMAESLRWEG
jgi:gamma-glutamylcyclotransferase (GGCT)/AIG2-like uncharacterized protein YtfP